MRTRTRQTILDPYLIFVISFTQAGFLNSKVLHPKTTQNTDKLRQIPQKDVKYAVICVQSGKFYTGQNFFTRAPLVVPVTNMRYGIAPGLQSSGRIGAVQQELEQSASERTRGVQCSLQQLPNPDQQSTASGRETSNASSRNPQSPCNPIAILKYNTNP